MKQFTFEGIKDLWDDWTQAVKTERIDLKDIRICQVKDIRAKNEKEDTATLFVTSTKDMTQKTQMVTVPHSLEKNLKKAGFFIQTKGKAYLPSSAIKSQCLYDYFQVSADEAPNSFTGADALLSLAAKFRRASRISFVSRRIGHGFRLLVSMKAASADNLGEAMLDIAGEFGDGTRFYSDYTEKKEPGVSFDVYCRIGEKCMADGTPLYVLLSDNATARKSMQAVIVADMDGRMLKLGHIDVNHRITTEGKQLAKKVISLLDSYEGMSLDTGVTSDEVLAKLSPYVPKLSLKSFQEFFTSSGLSPAKAAYDVMETGIFNRMEKQHKTLGYDGGKSAYESALAGLLLCNDGN